MGKALIGFLAVLSLWAGSANNTDVGMIKSIDGSGTLSVYDGNGVLHESKVDGRLFEHDKIVTKALQTVILELSEKSEIVLAPQSEFVIEKYIAGRRQTTILSLTYGMIRSLVKKVYSENEAFVVRTGNSAMGVRGTNFVVEVDKETGETTLSTLRGKVAIAATIEALKEPSRTIMVAAGLKSTMQTGMKSAATPTAINKTQMHERLQKTSPNFEKNLGPETSNLNEALRSGGAGVVGGGGREATHRFDRQGGIVSSHGSNHKGGDGKPNSDGGQDGQGPGNGSGNLAGNGDDDDSDNASGKGHGPGGKGHGPGNGHGGNGHGGNGPGGNGPGGNGPGGNGPGGNGPGGNGLGGGGGGAPLTPALTTNNLTLTPAPTVAPAAPVTHRIPANPAQPAPRIPR